MDIKELSFGDWVYNKHHDKPIKITQYDFFTHGHRENGEQYLNAHPIPTLGRDLEPIPLTPEILEKNGFEEVKHYYPYPTYEFRGIERCVVRVAFPKGSNKTKYEKPFVEIDSEQCWIAHVDTEYVHELQQTLKPCKIDKEIEL